MMKLVASEEPAEVRAGQVRHLATVLPRLRGAVRLLCAGHKRFFRHIDPAMKAMAGLIRQGRCADEIMRRNTP